MRNAWRHAKIINYAVTIENRKLSREIGLGSFAGTFLSNYFFTPLQPVCKPLLHFCLGIILYASTQ